MTGAITRMPQMQQYASSLAAVGNNYAMPNANMAPRAPMVPILTSKAHNQIMDAVYNTGMMMQQITSQYGSNPPQQVVFAASKRMAENMEAIRSALSTNTGHAQAGVWRLDNNNQYALDTSFDAAARMRTDTFSLTTPQEQFAYISKIANGAADWAAANNVPQHKGLQALVNGGSSPQTSNMSPVPGRYMPQPGYMPPQQGYMPRQGYMPGGMPPQMGQMPGGVGGMSGVNGVTSPGFVEPSLQELVGLVANQLGGIRAGNPNNPNDPGNLAFATTLVNTGLPRGQTVTPDQVLAIAQGKAGPAKPDAPTPPSVEDLLKARATEFGDLLPVFRPILDALKADGPEDAQNNLALLLKTLSEAFDDVAKSKNDIAPIKGNPELDGSAESGPFELNADKLGAVGKALMIAAGDDKGGRDKVMDFIRSAFKDLDYGVITDKEASGLYARLAKLTKSLDLEPAAAQTLLQSVFAALESE